MGRRSFCISALRLGSVGINKRRFTMKKILLAFVTLAFATSFAAPGFAAITDAKNKAECEKAGGVWIDKDNKCGAKKGQ
jgi:hypothetical protein